MLKFGLKAILLNYLQSIPSIEGVIEYKKFPLENHSGTPKVKYDPLSVKELAQCLCITLYTIVIKSILSVITVQNCSL